MTRLTLRDVLQSHALWQRFGRDGFVWMLERICQTLAETTRPHGSLRPQQIELFAGDVRLSGWDEPSQDVRSAPVDVLRYLAPEVVRAEPDALTTPADVFSLGAILYECLTRRAAFEGSSALQVRLALLSGSCTPPREVEESCPEGLSSLCLRILSRQKDLRPSLEELQGSLGELLPEGFMPVVLDGEALQSSPPTVAVAAPPAPAPPPRESPTPTAPHEETNASLFLPRAAQTSARARERALRTVEPSQFEWLGEIARGGLGKIERATDKSLSRVVAIKQLLRQDNKTKDRFLREIQLTAQLQHPSIVPLYEAGVWPSGEPFYSMKLISGEPLSETILQKKTLEERLSLLPNVLAACEAIAYAHSEKIIHRDLKPHNILLGGFGETVVIDWGLAKQGVEERARREERAEAPYRENNDEGLTVAGSIIGTPAYMPPEQARGEEVDARADVYSLGAVLYHLLAGVPPYQSNNARKILQDVLSRPPALLQVLQPKTPRDLLAIVQKAMARDKRERYPNAKALAQDIQKFQTGQLVGAYQYSLGERARRFLQKYRALVWVSTIAVCLLGAGGFLSIRSIVEKERLANQRADALSLVSARAVLETDPQKAITILQKLSPDFTEWGAARIIAADSLSRGRPKIFPGYQESAGDEEHAISLSPDGKFLAFGRPDFAVELRQLETGAVAVLRGHQSPLLDLVFSHDGSVLASLDRTSELRLWEVGPSAQCSQEENCNTSRSFQGPKHRARFGVIAFSSEDRYVAWSNADQQIQLIDRRANTLSSLEGPTQELTGLVFSPDTRLLYSCDKSGAVIAWELSRLLSDPASGASSAPQSLPTSQPDLPGGALWRYEAKTMLWRLYLSPDGATLLTAGIDQKLRFIDAATGREALPALSQPNGFMAQATFSPDGQKLAYVGYDEKVRLFDLATQASETWPGHNGQVMTARFSPDGRWLATGSADTTARLWEVKTGKSILLAGHQEPLWWVSFSADGETLFSAGADRTVRQWDISAQDIERLPGLVLSPEKRRNVTENTIAFLQNFLLAAAPGGAVTLLDLKTQQRRTLDPGVGGVLHILPSRDGRWVAFSGLDGPVALYQMTPSGPNKARTFLGHKGYVDALAFSWDGEWLASGGGDKEIRLWSVTGDEERTLPGSAGDIICLAFSADDRFLFSGGMEPVLHAWELSRPDSTKNLAAKPTNHSRIITTQENIIFPERYTIQLWDAAQTQKRELAHKVWGLDLVLSPDQTKIAVAYEDGSIALWDLKTGALLRTLRGHSSEVRDLAFSPDGGRLVSGSRDRTLRLWDVATGESRVITGHEDGVYQVEFSPDGKLIASASYDGTVRLWRDELPTDPKELQAFLRAQ